jgi:hypothetical protein
MERDDGKEEARRILERMAQEEAASPMQRMARRAQGHFSAADADPEDRIEVVGTRIGRALAFVIVLMILAWLFLYVLRGG